VLRLCQVIRPVPRLCVVIRNKYWVLRGRVVSPPPNPQAGRPPTVGCPRLLIQYIRSYPPYLEAVSSIRNPRTRHAVVTVDPLNMDATCYRTKLIFTHIDPIYPWFTWISYSPLSILSNELYEYSVRNKIFNWIVKLHCIYLKRFCIRYVFSGIRALRLTFSHRFALWYIFTNVHYHAVTHLL
jgi:hypothetical protein